MIKLYLDTLKSTIIRFMQDFFSSAKEIATIMLGTGVISVFILGLWKFLQAIIYLILISQNLPASDQITNKIVYIATLICILGFLVVGALSKIVSGFIAEYNRQLLRNKDNFFSR